jgi:F-type H+-transporting ATPase subunit b
MEPHSTQAVVAAEAPGGQAHGSADLMKVSASMMGLTWLTFLIVAAVLYKVAWKPILAGLERREASIRKALEDAERARQELAGIEEQRRRTIDEADAKAKEIVEIARRAALDAAGAIEQKAREESQILLENAQREIRTAHEKAIASIRRESADLAVGIARKIIGESLDEARARAMTDKLIRDI